MDNIRSKFRQRLGTLVPKKIAAAHSAEKPSAENSKLWTASKSDMNIGRAIRRWIQGRRR